MWPSAAASRPSGQPVPTRRSCAGREICRVTLRGRRRFLPWRLFPADWRLGSSCCWRREGGWVRGRNATAEV